MKLFTLVGERVYTGEGGPFRGYVTIAGGRTVAVGEGRPGDLAGRLGDLTDHGDLGDVLYVGQARVIPGLIDLHIHGAKGYSAASESAKELEELARYLAQGGTTAFQPTAGAAPVTALEKTIELVRDLSRGPVNGARSLGLHLEGPFLNPARKGAMPEECLLAPGLDLARRWLVMGEGTVGHMTVAPELPGALDLIAYLASRGVTVSLGHTDATYDQMVAGFGAGATVANHTFNAMRGLHHREPGAVGAALTSDDVFCEIIADGIHVHEAAIQILLRAKGPDRVCLISDAIPAAGLGQGKYTFLGREVTVDHRGRGLLSGGTLAGSTALLKDGLRKVVEDLGVPFEVALRMATVNPAKIAKVWDHKGSLAPGKDADVVVLDESYKVLFSMVEGQIQKEYEGA